MSGSIEVKGVPIEAIENPEENREEDQEESIESLKQKFGLMQFLLEIGNLHNATLQLMQFYFLRHLTIHYAWTDDCPTLF